jgi:Tol biopolymer transport system component
MPLGGGPRQVFLRNPNGTITAITPLANGDCDSPSVTPDGRFVAFASAASNLVPGDTEGFTDVFVFDATSGMLARASVDVNGSGAGGNGDSGEPTLSADGNYIAYVSRATNVTVPDSTRPDSNPNGLLDLVLAVQPFGNP